MSVNRNVPDAAASENENFAVMRFTRRQRAFIREYLQDPCASRAADRAGYKRPGHAGWRNLRRPDVRRAIALAQKERAAAAGRRALDVLRDIQSLTSRALESGALNIALKGLELEGKHLGMFAERNKPGRTGLDLAQAINEARRRVQR